MIVHVKKDNNLKVQVIEEEKCRRIKGYSCSKNCTTCPMYNVGEPLYRSNQSCKNLSEKDLLISIKIDKNLSEEVMFS